ncbi:MAG: hypothetical protein KGL38_03260, partial [Gemmatimonadota bacterium]|nr:hypothetical protein [Gemmatimonadota bacterium]
MPDAPPRPPRPAAAPSTRRPWRGVSIGIKAPIFLSTLFAVVVGINSWTSYRLRLDAERREASERLAQVAAEMVDGLGQIRRQLAQDMSSAAASPAVRAYLSASPGRRAILAPLAAAALRSAGSTRELVGVELRDAAGRVVLRLGAPERFAARAESVVREAADSSGLVVGPLQIALDSAAYPAAIRVAVGGRAIGYVVAWRRLNASPQGARQVSRLVGAGARVLIGNPGDSAWTDLSVRANPPPIDVDTAAGVLEYRRRRGEMLAVARR